MSRRRTPRTMVVGMDPQVRCGSELASQLSREYAIQAAEYARGVMGKDGNGLHRHFDHGRDERRRDAMPRDVCHQNAQMVAVCPDELVKIARDRGHGMVSSSNTQVLKLGNAGRKNRRLYLPGSLQFSLDGKQTALVRKHDLQIGRE